MQEVKRSLKFATALLCSCGSSSQIVCRATFNSLNRLTLRLEFIVLFQHGAPANMIGVIAGSRWSSSVAAAVARGAVGLRFLLRFGSV